MLETIPASVIIPTYNGMRYLPETLESVLRQSFGEFEVIIVDNGSTDQTASWVKSVRDPRVRYHYQENSGSPTGSRNTGISLSRGEFLAFIDSDDIWQNTKLEKQIPLFKQSSVGLVYCRTQLIDAEGRYLGKKFDGTPRRGNVLAPLIRKNFVCCSSVVIRRRILDDYALKFLDGRPCAEDWDLWLRIAAISEFDFVEECLLDYRSHSSNLSGNIEVIYRSRLTVLQDVLARELARNFERSEEIRDAGKKARADIELRYAHGLNATGRRTEAIRAMLDVIRRRPTYFRAWWGLLKCVFGLRR